MQAGTRTAARYQTVTQSIVAKSVDIIHAATGLMRFSNPANGRTPVYNWHLYIGYVSDCP
jgi:hypothetical protein